MRIKLDENLPTHIASELRTRGHDVHTVEQEGLLGHSDQEIWLASQREQRFLITQDLDFSDARSFVPGTHHGILLMRLVTPSKRRLFERIEELFESEDIESWARCFVVASDQASRASSAASKLSSP
jgi:predicted nuclease of predicted toxin-antitoxin system